MSLGAGRAHLLEGLELLGDATTAGDELQRNARLRSSRPRHEQSAAGLRLPVRSAGRLLERTRAPPRA